jgi:uncharacterized protein (TIGR04255 family)
MSELIRVPLKEAVIEVRFPGDARIEAWRGEFQKTVRAKLPQLFVPGFQPGQFAALAHYQFANANRTEIVSLAINSLAYAVQEYPGWEHFKTEFLRHWETLEQEIQPETLSHVGVRYINSFDTEADLMNLRSEPPHEYLAPLSLNPDFFQSVVRFNMDADKMQVGVVRSEQSQAITIDLDCFATDVKPVDLQNTLDRLHTNVESEFFASLNDEFVEQLTPVG